MAITEGQWREVALSDDEYRRIVELLGREPSLVELGMFGAMWSEHCGYKHSRPHLKQLPTEAPWVLQGPGENAGAVDIGNGLAAVFKVESHNHPSAVEPYEGAATGIGGIVRDIFTMGARPIAILDALRFGALDRPRNQYLFSHVVAGIGGYGNCLGIPTVGGETAFDSRFDGNPIVNAMCVGIVPHDGIVRAKASGVGNRIVLIGAKTGRDGLHGAMFASVDDPETSHRGVIQVGNPFLEKQLMEACLELLQTDTVVAMQDLGAAGMTSSIVEIASRGGVGADVDVLKVPRREEGMTPYEIMLSESQERMVLVCAPDQVTNVIRVLDRWSLAASDIGTVTDDGLVIVREGDEVVCKVPVGIFVDECPTYHVTASEPEVTRTRREASIDPDVVASEARVADELAALIAHPNLGTRRSIWEQYDHTILTNTVVGPGGDAAVLRVKGTPLGVALSIDCNSRYCDLDPYNGARLAVAEASRNVSCAGAKPLGITNCLNMGNPEQLPGSWHLQEAVRGIADACRDLGVPVVSGNVSLYNESNGVAIQPTPMIGCVGVLDDVTRVKHHAFQDGDDLILVSSGEPTLGGSEWLSIRGGRSEGTPPSLDMATEARLQTLLRDLATRDRVHSVHDISQGGLAVAVAEGALAGDIGADLSPGEAGGRHEILRWFGEYGSAAIIAAEPSLRAAIFDKAESAGLDATMIGRAIGDAVIFPDGSSVSLASLRTASESALVSALETLELVSA
ncbi:MAG TPA: phosphoribosylformylglycinamidine synthase subunit PurL [Thermomicrobiales bacterium]|nr:phosphoribosylformylglycinamidine synthase subunit PurL [Thermomicrobiales bacterium]